LISPVIDATALTTVEMSFREMIDDYAGQDSNYNLSVQVKDDGVWNYARFISPKGNIAASSVNIDLSPFAAGREFQFGFLFSGDSYDINAWYIDDIKICGEE